MQNSTAPPDTSNGQLKALRWISTVLSILVVLMAFMIGEALFGGQMDLVQDHGYLGNAIFALAVIQVVLAFLQYQKGVVSRNLLLLSGLLIILLFGQIGLGYTGTSGTTEAIVYHIPLGVLIMGVSTVNAVLFWVQPRQEPVVA